MIGFAIIFLALVGFRTCVGFVIDMGRDIIGYIRTRRALREMRRG